MKSLRTMALLTGFLVVGCKTASTDSDLRADGDTAVTPGASFDLASLKNTFWKSTFDGGPQKISLSVRFESDGQGVIISGSIEETVKAEFSAAHMANSEQLAQAVALFGADSFPDASGAQVRYTEALIVTDKEGGLVSILPILHANEMVIFPVGTVVKQAKAQDADL